jgi:hypothetical protein
MALTPIDSTHAAQIQAGMTGRRYGHNFEADLANCINNLPFPQKAAMPIQPVFRGEPATVLICFTLTHVGWSHCDRAEAIALGALATAEEGKKWLEVNGVAVRACKSDVLLTVFQAGREPLTIGVSVKQCNNRTPTNAQLYFSTAHAFCELLRRNNIPVSDYGETSLRQFCGDLGYRPLDNPTALLGRKTDPRRFFCEETEQTGRQELEDIFRDKQDYITRLLLQKAYLADPFTPDLILHKTKRMLSDPQEFALYSVEQLINLSRRYQGFTKKLYTVHKGQYKDPHGTQHEAPRFGVVQMQRGGQQQHPTQLQFNLEAGYFYKI